MSKKFTIFGNPVKHSISPKMHTFAIDGFSLDATYNKTLLEEGNRLKEIFLSNFNGANVTVPHKEIAYKSCDEIRGIASDIGAVNTLINENGKMIGYNTDAEGFFKSIEEFGEIKTAIILGAGGTSKAISFIFKQHKIETTILNRSANRLTSFKENGFLTYDWNSFKPKKYDLIVNTTSAGLGDENYPAPLEILESLLKEASFAIDVIYNKQTPFLKLAKKYNLPTKDGADMLLYQGVLAFNLFYDNRFDFEEITSFMKKAF
jgi:shikimate dehydrogenase